MSATKKEETKEKQSFIFYADWAEAIRSLKSDRLQLQLYRALSDYGLKGIEPEDVDVLAIFNFMKGQLDRDHSKYMSKVDQCSNAGKNHKGNQYTRAKEKAQNGTAVPLVPKNGTNGTYNVNDNVNDNYNSTDNISKYKDEIEIIDVEDVDNIVIDKIPFKDFWDLYDKRNDRKACEQKWNALSRKTQETIMEAVRIYKINQPKKRYRKDPIRFLGKELWKNEYCLTINDDDKNGKQPTGNNTIFGVTTTSVNNANRNRTEREAVERLLRGGKG